MNILIVGAGAAGLMTGKLLSQAGHQITILEARDRIGGRAHTIHNKTYSFSAEEGAEFIHGDLPETMALLKEAGLEYEPSSGEFLKWKEGEWLKLEASPTDHPEFLKAVEALEEDMTINDFLITHFGTNEYDDMREQLISYVEGYDAADINKASTLALVDEWKNQGYEQYRIKKGYGALMQYLAAEIEKAGGNIKTSSVVKEIRWLPRWVQVITKTGEKYVAEKVILALPLGVLQASAKSDGKITFYPSIEDKLQQIKKLGFGSVIKILLWFTDLFWEDEKVHQQSKQNTKQMGFLLSDAAIPTWWTQYPNHTPLLTGWLGGPKAQELKDADDQSILQLALNSLSQIFSISHAALSEKLLHSHIHNWSADPLAMGAYTYATVDTTEVLKNLSTPIDNTFYFAGAGFYNGPHAGTVEAALVSARDAAKKVEASLNVEAPKTEPDQV